MNDEWKVAVTSCVRESGLGVSSVWGRGYRESWFNGLLWGQFIYIYKKAVQEFSLL